MRGLLTAVIRVDYFFIDFCCACLVKVSPVFERIHRNANAYSLTLTTDPQTHGGH